MSGLPVSFANLRIVTEDILADRIETVKTLAEDDMEAYQIEKDKQTGDHYLHYAVRHLNVAAGGAEEVYHHLMPLEHDDVIALALGSPDYSYPANWTRPYLRNGPSGGFVWYDPDGAPSQTENYDEVAKQIREKLAGFREAGRNGPEEVERLMKEVDGLFDDPAK
jgi:hypothetical protein